MNISKTFMICFGFFLLVKFWLIKHAFDTSSEIISNNDQFFKDRGFSKTCQILNSAEWKQMKFSRNDSVITKRLCESGAKKSLILYLDSIPLDLFSYFHKDRFFGEDKFGHLFSVKHYGISDSGPAFSSLITGKIANNYEGLITDVDNLFHQLHQSGQKINAHGYHYPIYEMIGSGYFDNYNQSEKGLSFGLCKDFLNIYEIYTEYKSTESEIQISSQLEMKKTYGDFYLYYKRKIAFSKANITDCIQQIFDKSKYFNIRKQR